MKLVHRICGLGFSTEAFGFVSDDHLKEWTSLQLRVFFICWMVVFHPIRVTPKRLRKMSNAERQTIHDAAYKRWRKSK